MRACYKRPISVEQIEKIIDEIETEIFNKEDREIPSTEIGEIVMDKLKDLDAVTYVRFASVYREFKDVNTFMDELKKILIDRFRGAAGRSSLGHVSKIILAIPHHSATITMTIK